MPKRFREKLFPPIEPYRKGFLWMGDGHRIYFEECGNPDGFPLLYIHGGPGVGCSPLERRYVDPGKWRAILFDQRGSNRSRPFGSLEHNTTWDLVEDIQKLCDKLEVKRAVLWGGSWGATLGLVAAISYPDLVAGMVLRGIFLGTREETRWFLGGGADHFFPAAWERFMVQVPEKERHDPVRYYYEAMGSGSRRTRELLAREWSRYEDSIIYLKPLSAEELDKEGRSPAAVSAGILEAHYLLNDCFLPENYILDNAYRIPKVPITIIQGIYDVACKPIYAWNLHKALPWSELHLVVAGHSKRDPEMRKKLVSETERMYYEIEK